MLEYVLTAVFVLITVGAALIINGYFWGWFYAASTCQDETHYFLADDGWRLAVHRYRAKGPPKGAPVVLCHGVGANRYIFDLPGAHSLARFLSKRGRDIWVVELRGSGMSDRPGLLYSNVPYSWTFDDHLNYDVPAVINQVIVRTGAPAVHWIGHSMGGMLIQAHLAEQDRPRICSAVTLGSPVDFSKVRMRAVRILSKMRNFLKLTPIPPMPFNGRLVIPVAHRIPGYLFGLFYPPNIDSPVVKRIIAVGSELIASRKLWLDLGRFVDTGEFSNQQGRRYLERLFESPVPILIAGGGMDMMAPPNSITTAFVPGRDVGKRVCHIFGKASGTVEDYGHVDLLVGIRSEQEVFPIILSWLEAHDPDRGESVKC
jgi:pimeloyl-ACP methyl ester carboxylesterase